MPHPNRKVEVCLDEPVRRELQAVVRSGSAPASRVRKARVLLLADEDRREGQRTGRYRLTPAMQAGVVDTLWSFADLYDAAM